MVLAGTYRILFEDKVFDAPVGTSVTVPRGSRHSWRNISNKTGRLLVILTPGGFDKCIQTMRDSPEVTCQILLPYWDFEPVFYGREELERLYRSVFVVVASLEDPGDPFPGDHCHFCPARLICGAAKDAATNATLTKVTQLPLGRGAAELLDQIKRAQALFKEIEGYYKRVLQETPGAIPGWMLEPGDVRRSIQDTVALHLHTAEPFSVEELLSCCSLSAPALERAWVEKNGIPANRAKEEFKKFLGPLLIEKRTVSSLRKAAQ